MSRSALGLPRPVTDPDAPHARIRALRIAVATRRGDDGTTGLLFGGERIAKDDLRTEAYGTIDEAVAALGLARAELGVKRRVGTLERRLRRSRRRSSSGSSASCSSWPPSSRRSPRPGIASRTA